MKQKQITTCIDVKGSLGQTGLTVLTSGENRYATYGKANKSNIIVVSEMCPIVLS